MIHEISSQDFVFLLFFKFYFNSSIVNTKCYTSFMVIWAWEDTQAFEEASANPLWKDLTSKQSSEKSPQIKSQIKCELTLKNKSAHEMSHQEQETKARVHRQLNLYRLRLLGVLDATVPLCTKALWASPAGALTAQVLWFCTCSHAQLTRTAGGCMWAMRD